MIDIEIIMNNTYGVLTNRCSVEDILYQYEGTDAMFYGNLYNIECSDIDEVINFYENTEEYENCMQLVYIRDDKIGELLIKKLMRDAL